MKHSIAPYYFNNYLSKEMHNTYFLQKKKVYGFYDFPDHFKY